MLRYSGNVMGTFTLVQQRDDEEKPRKFKIQIREGNCLAVFLYVYKEEEPKDPKLPYINQLVSFLADETHLKNCEKAFKKGQVFASIVGGKLQNIKLNMYYQDSKVLLKHMLKDGLEVKCFYKK